MAAVYQRTLSGSLCPAYYRLEPAAGPKPVRSAPGGPAMTPP
jgi:hypothetical protein